uniref:hypothetical protein n=1 Tax=Pseudomonas aeruginosa TaxID=287 RepID=UPI0021AF507C|nr:hypothetical protein [Pseudomonas aeruginosa]
MVVGHELELGFGDLAQSFDFVYWSAAGERLVVPLQRIYSVGVQGASGRRIGIVSVIF